MSSRLKHLTQVARPAALGFFGAMAAYLLYLPVMAKLLVWATLSAKGPQNIYLRTAWVVVLVDATKVIGLLPTAWVLGAWTSTRAWVMATWLVLLVAVLEGSLAWSLGPAPTSWTVIPVLVLRGLALFGLGYATMWILRWRQKCCGLIRA